MLANMWGTELLVSDKMIGAMVNVRIPVEPNSTVVQHLPDRLLEKYNTWVRMQVLCVWYVWGRCVIVFVSLCASLCCYVRLFFIS